MDEHPRTMYLLAFPVKVLSVHSDMHVKQLIAAGMVRESRTLCATLINSGSALQLLCGILENGAAPEHVTIEPMIEKMKMASCHVLDNTL
ncbi:hypothetical protein EJB05_09896 [Eragrostis curvula]|uniref:Uncharacterized protein n=1 Tax=Eragrostis curvula TaxID=38414 RepID=A0A5J9W642_9POAL|nr:hypothetical protein EJB05_09896 [Eragrostis curvula]